ncbi:MFS transporter [Cupriavidus metallidurans]|uniref:MFS transporter n=1 Tax=Cupriavidus TaxID=106589 RepID=UPI0002A1C8DD|nr:MULTISPECIES: MFS transporter [Cupriavidus]ELA00191.1 major facilitator superfamily permease [Cupriavidus sp. HMR-1]GMG92932.1 MFS transporter [Cupriavidus sp. TKC]HBD39257.1 MFS transporter [Cupriavidus sp.]HBO81937.1 MFS transporter [Cupriavidus sp.]
MNTTFHQESTAAAAETNTSRGIALLTFAFILSQFYRSCLAVIAPELQHDFGLSPAGFGALSSCFFLAFAVAQIPVGIAFDRYGVGRPTAVLLGVGAVSAIGFVVAPNAGMAMLVQMGLGLACAPVFMGLLHYASEQLSERQYMRVGSRSNALGMIGALCATAPLGWASQHVGWRPAMALAAVCMVVACYGVWRFVRDDGHEQARQAPMSAMLVESGKLLGYWPLWTLIPLCVAMSAGTGFRNAWSGPYLADVFGLQAGTRGMALMLLSLAGFLTAFALPVLVRRSSLKAAIGIWGCLATAGGIALTIWPDAGVASGVGMMALLSTIGMLHPLVMAQGRALIPAPARGRGLGLLNTFVFLGSALTSWGFGLIANVGHLRDWPVAHTYSAIFLSAVVVVALSLVPYYFSPISAPAAKS